MNNPQNIDDILKLLKNSYGEAKDEDTYTAEDNPEENDVLSHKELQEKLKKQFMSDVNIEKSDAEPSESSDYEIAKDFINEEFVAEENVGEKDEEDEGALDEIKIEASADVISDDGDDGIPPFDLAEADEEAEETDGIEIITDLEDTNEQSVLDEVTEEYDEDDSDEDGIFAEDENGNLIIIQPILYVEHTDHVDAEQDKIALVEDTSDSEDTSAEEAQADEVVFQEINEAEEAFEAVSAEAVAEDEVCFEEEAPEVENEIVQESAEPAEDEAETVVMADDDSIGVARSAQNNAEEATPKELTDEELTEEEKLENSIVFADEMNLSTDEANEKDPQQVTVIPPLNAKETISIFESQIRENELFSDNSGQLAMFEARDEETVPLDKDDDVYDSEQQSDEHQMTMDFGASDVEDELISESKNDAGMYEDVDSSVISLMLEFGDTSAVGAEIENKHMDAYIDEINKESIKKIEPTDMFAFDGEEYEDKGQTDEFKGTYRREKMFMILRVLGCAFFSVLLALYEIVGTFELEIRWVFDYGEYPVIYLLGGLQLFIFSVIFAWRELLSGLRKILAFKSGRWSLVAVVCLFAMLYSIAIMIICPDDVPYLFGTIASMYVLFGLLSELFKVYRESKSFDVYSSDKNKFSFATEAKSGSLADKMYRGGISDEKRIFEPVSVEFPRGYFSSINASEDSEIFMNYMITPAIVVSTIVMIVCAVIGESAEASLAAFMAVISLLSPLSLFATHTFPIFKTSSNLYYRDCAVAGESAALKYADCDYIIFKDMHLFKSSCAEDNGIVIMDERKTRVVVEYLDAIYEKIGGPMKGVFSGFASSEHIVKLRRIARNGVEATIDHKHSVILGDADFLRRYGVYCEGMDRAETGILCFVIDGRPAAKLCLKYKTEPLFEMLLEKLDEEGVGCAIETYDPAINSTFVAFCREDEDAQVNVVHKNAADYYNGSYVSDRENTGLVVCSSRLKLVEAMIWCKKLKKVLRMCNLSQIITSIAVFATVVILVALGHIEQINQYFVMLSQLICMIPVFVFTAFGFPRSDMFLQGKYTDTVKKDTKEPKKKKQDQRN